MGGQGRGEGQGARAGWARKRPGQWRGRNWSEKAHEGLHAERLLEVGVVGLDLGQVVLGRHVALVPVGHGAK